VESSKGTSDVTVNIDLARDEYIDIDLDSMLHLSWSLHGPEHLGAAFFKAAAQQTEN
jgi:hypothetical protein